MKSRFNYLSHAWHYDRKSCEVYVTLLSGNPPSAGDTVYLEAGRDELPLQVLAARWQDEQSGGILVLHVAGEQKDVIDLFSIGSTIYARQP